MAEKDNAFIKLPKREYIYMVFLIHLTTQELINAVSQPENIVMSLIAEKALQLLQLTTDEEMNEIIKRHNLVDKEAKRAKNAELN
jgi:hypothetical protein